VSISLQGDAISRKQSRKKSFLRLLLILLKTLVLKQTCLMTSYSVATSPLSNRKQATISGFATSTPNTAEF
jgi:hypothetical protein